MNKPNFDSMTHKELQNYILAHRDDAIHAMVLKIEADPNTITVNPDEDTGQRLQELLEEREKRYT